MQTIIIMDAEAAAAVHTDIEACPGEYGLFDWRHRRRLNREICCVTRTRQTKREKESGGSE
jgi:hypothetical protein